jgi:WD40 repeat protein
MKRGVALIFLFFALILFSAVYSQGAEYELTWSYGTKGWAKSVSLSKDGGYVAAGSQDTYVYFFDRDGELLWRYQTGGLVNSVSLPSDGSYVAAGSDNSNLYFFDKKASAFKPPLWSYDLGSKGVSWVSVSGDGAYIAAASEYPENNVHFLNKKGTLLWSVSIGDAIQGLDISSDGSLIVAGASDGGVYFLEKDKKLLWSLDLGNFGVTSVSVSEDGSLIAAGTRDDKLHLISNFRDRRGAPLWSARIDGGLKQVLIPSDGSLVAALSKNNVIYFFSSEGELLNKAEMARSSGLISISGDGSKIAAGSNFPVVRVYYYSQPLPPPDEVIEKPKKPKMILLANSIDRVLAEDFLVLLNNRDIRIIKVTASNFEHFSGEKFILILGGPDSQEGVGEFVIEVISTAEQNALREEGAKEMHRRSNVWNTDQKVWVVAGSNRSLTRESLGENWEKIALEFESG